MPLFPRKGETNVTEPLSTIYQRDADRMAADRTGLAAQISPKRKRIDELALAAENGDAEALAECDVLEREVGELHRVVRRKLHAERQLRASAEAELKSEHWQRDQHLRRKLANHSGKRLDPAKRLEKHAALLLSDIKELQQENEALHLAWNEAWPFKGPALTYRIAELIAHELFAQARAIGVKWPEARYSQAEWPGLSAMIKQANEWVKHTLLEDEVPVVELALDPTPVSPVLADAPQVQSNMGVVQDLLGAPTALSGADWQALQDAKPKTPIADGIDYLADTF